MTTKPHTLARRASAALITTLAVLASLFAFQAPTASAYQYIEKGAQGSDRVTLSEAMLLGGDDWRSTTGFTTWLQYGNVKVLRTPSTTNDPQYVKVTVTLFRKDDATGRWTQVHSSTETGTLGPRETMTTTYWRYWIDTISRNTVRHDYQVSYYVAHYRDAARTQLLRGGWVTPTADAADYRCVTDQALCDVTYTSYGAATTIRL